jgi:hypothetical protein
VDIDVDTEEGVDDDTMKDDEEEDVVVIGGVRRSQNTSCSTCVASSPFSSGSCADGKEE